MDVSDTFPLCLAPKEDGSLTRNGIWFNSENVEDLPSRQLRRKLDALEALIGSLSRRSIPLSPSISPVIVPIEIPPVPPPSEFARKSVSPSSSPSRHLLVRSLFVNGTLQQVELPGINTALLEYEVSVVIFLSLAISEVDSERSTSTASKIGQRFLSFNSTTSAGSTDISSNSASSSPRNLLLLLDNQPYFPPRSRTLILPRLPDFLGKWSGGISDMACAVLGDL